jgi:hypothetical protein
MNSEVFGHFFSDQVVENPIPNPIPEPLSSSDDAQLSPTKLSPKRGRGRPAGSFKANRRVTNPIAHVDRKPRSAGRSSGSSIKASRNIKHRNDVTVALGTHHNAVHPGKVTASLPYSQGRAPQHLNSLNMPQNLDTEAPAVPPVPEVVCTHDFSFISQIEMRRLAAACLASAMRKSSEDPRFAAHSASLQSVSAELEARVLTQGALDHSLWHS